MLNVQGDGWLTLCVLMGIFSYQWGRTYAMNSTHVTVLKQNVINLSLLCETFLCLKRGLKV